MWRLSGFADEISPDLDLQLRTLGDLGISHLEFRSAWNVNVLDLTDAQLDVVQAGLSSSAIAVSSIGSPIGKVSLDADFDEHLRRFDRAVDVCQRFACPYIRIFSFYVPAAGSAAVRDRVLARLSAFVDRVKGTDIVLLHENEKGIYGDSPERCRDLAVTLASPHFQLAWDAGNFVQCGVRPFTDAYQLLREHVAYVQVKDANLHDGGVVPPGKGDGEIRQTLRALHLDGFEGYLSLEPHLAESGQSRGFSGIELFSVAHRALTEMLIEEGIPFQ